MGTVLSLRVSHYLIPPRPTPMGSSKIERILTDRSAPDNSHRSDHKADFLSFLVFLSCPSTYVGLVTSHHSVFLDISTHTGANVS